ncbi:hypothetical protein ACIHCM_04785 [Streptomyces sp. NPDC052023]|uniref:hypothetical protein n=1 Tax=Streptomyces sp. NPDC052023 TaxID=3365681 RepID=UPI0037D00CA2
MSTEQRKSPENALWLCLSCSKVIDASPAAFTVDGLLAWKKNAEMLAARDSKVTADHVGTLLVEIEAARMDLIRFCSYWQAADPSNEWPSEFTFNEMTERILKHSTLRRAAYHEEIAPRVSRMISVAQTILGPDSDEVASLAHIFTYAETNYLSMLNCAKALQRVADVLAMR